MRGLYGGEGFDVTSPQTSRLTSPLASPLLSRTGAVAADPPDEMVATHYGDPLREQRMLVETGGLVDRSNRSVLTVTGPDRLSWLHTITSQHLATLAPMHGGEALVLSPHGHVEHHLVVADDGETTWLDVEPGTADALLRYLDSMRFLLRVEPSDVSAHWAVVTVFGSDVPDGLPTEAYAVQPLSRGGFARRMPPLGPDVATADLVVPRKNLADLDVTSLAGLWAYDALRIEAARPRLCVDTDSRTLPHEVGWIGVAVHLDKGCYRGQETVARVHNLGRPPRRLVVLQLDGSVEALPRKAAPIEWQGRPVGVVGTSARHHELGPVALALVKRAVPDDAELLADGIAARVDPALSLVAGQPAAPRARVTPLGGASRGRR